jgi:phage-related protein
MSVVSKIEGYEKTLAATLPAIVGAIVTALSSAANIIPSGAANYVLLVLSFLTVVSVWLTKNADPLTATVEHVINDVANSVTPVVQAVAPDQIDEFQKGVDAAKEALHQVEKVALDAAKAVTDAAG